MSHPFALAAIVLAMSSFFAWLSAPRSGWQFCKVLIASVIFLVSLMGLGAVFGKTLGDFLRNVNG